MGSMLEAECPCGYVKSEISSGVGMLGIGHEPGICHKCREIVSVTTHQIGMPPDFPSKFYKIQELLNIDEYLDSDKWNTRRRRTVTLKRTVWQLPTHTQTRHLLCSKS